MAWTQATIDNLKSKHKPYKKQENNLVVKVQPTGRVSYYAYINRQYRIIGTHPELKLRQARIKKEEMFHDKYMGKIEPTKETFKDFVYSSDFQDWSSGERKTHEARMACMKSTILPIIGHVKLAQLKKTDIQRYKNKRKKHVKETTINRELNDISAVLTQAKEMERINKRIKIKKFKEDEGIERRMLEDWEVRKLRDSAHSIKGLNKGQANQKKHIGLVIDIALWCGLRKGEILSLTWGDIVNKGHYLKELDSDSTELGDAVKASSDILEAGFSDYAFEIKGSNAKTGQSRFVPISSELFMELMIYYSKYVTEEGDILETLKAIQTFNKNPKELSDIDFDKILFQPNKEQRIFPYKKVDNAFNTARDNAGLPKEITLHSLRHNFCSKALESGMSLHTVKDLAGHASITTTEIYLHANPRLKFLEYQKFSNSMKKITES